MSDRLVAVARALDRHSLRLQGWTKEAIERAMKTTAIPSPVNLENARVAIEAYEAASPKSNEGNRSPNRDGEGDG